MRSIIRVILFVSLNLVLFYFIHAFIFNTSFKYLEITDPILRNTIVYCFSGLSILFLVSIFLSHIYHNLIIKIGYYIGAVWLGILVNLFSLFLLNRMIITFAYWLNIALNSKLLHIVILLLTLIIVIYGLFNAAHIIIKSINIQIKNLEEGWLGKKIVFISDVHLGAIYGDRFLSRLVNKINKLSPDIVIIGGDLFDGSKGNYKSFINRLNKIESKHGIYFIIGNHESYMNQKFLGSIFKELKFNILDNKYVNVNGLQIIGINLYISDKSSIIEGFNETVDKSVPLLLINHEPNNIAYAKNIGTDLMLSGHTHKGQFFPFTFFTSLIYKRYNYGLNKDGGFHSYTSSGVGSWGPPMRTLSRSEIVVINFSTSVNN